LYLTVRLYSTSRSVITFTTAITDPTTGSVQIFIPNNPMFPSLSQAIAGAGVTSLFSVDQKFRPSVTSNYNLNVQASLGRVVIALFLTIGTASSLSGGRNRGAEILKAPPAPIAQALHAPTERRAQPGNEGGEGARVPARGPVEVNRGPLMTSGTLYRPGRPRISLAPLSSPSVPHHLYRGAEF
jgi:hypothetical protein